MIKYAEVCLDMDERRTVWQVCVYDENDNCIEMRPFRDKEDADLYAESIQAERRAVDL